MGKHVETHGPESFPSTRWSRLLTGSEGGGTGHLEGLETLARRYWRPIVAYIRARWARSDEEAHDAAQAFFLWMMETGFLERADPDRGRFRGLIKKSLSNFLHDVERQRRTVKRGGDHRFLTLTANDEGPLDLADGTTRTPEALLDELWRRTLLAQAAQDLERELQECGRAVVFEVFRDCVLREETIDYATIAKRHGISTVDVSNHLSDAKRRYRTHLRRAVLETVDGDQDLRAELAWLLDEQSG